MLGMNSSCLHVPKDAFISFLFLNSIFLNFRILSEQLFFFSSNIKFSGLYYSWWEIYGYSSFLCTQFFGFLKIYVFLKDFTFITGLWISVMIWCEVPRCGFLCVSCPHVPLNFFGLWSCCCCCFQIWIASSAIISSTYFLPLPLFFSGDSIMCVSAHLNLSHS